MIAQIGAAQFVPTVFKDGEVNGTFFAPEAGELVLSMPYDSGWKITVDGEVTSLSPLYNGGMSSIPVEVGEHSIEMEYRSPGIIFGAIVSACTAALALLLSRLTRKERKSV